MLRFLLRFAAVIFLALAVFLVLLHPKETVVSADFLTKANVSVQCSSVWDEWTHHAQPASLQLNGTSIVHLQAAQNSCQSASHKIKEVAAALTLGGLAALGLSFVRRRAGSR